VAAVCATNMAARTVEGLSTDLAQAALEPNRRRPVSTRQAKPTLATRMAKVIEVAQGDFEAGVLPMGTGAWIAAFANAVMSEKPSWSDMGRRRSRTVMGSGIRPNTPSISRPAMR
jgi:hypothetical protein